MVFDQKVCFVIMLTSLVEDGMVCTKLEAIFILISLMIDIGSGTVFYESIQLICVLKEYLCYRLSAANTTQTRVKQKSGEILLSNARLVSTLRRTRCGNWKFTRLVLLPIALRIKTMTKTCKQSKAVAANASVKVRYLISADIANFLKATANIE